MHSRISAVLFVELATISTRIFLLFYSDPGSGAMLWQMIAAFFVGGLFYLTFAYQKLKSFILGILSTGDAKIVLTKKDSFNRKDLLEN